MVNAATLAKMKKGAILVNCARGGIVDEKALADVPGRRPPRRRRPRRLREGAAPGRPPALQARQRGAHPAPRRLDRGGPGGGGGRGGRAARRPTCRPARCRTPSTCRAWGARCWPSSAPTCPLAEKLGSLGGQLAPRRARPRWRSRWPASWLGAPLAPAGQPGAGRPAAPRPARPPVNEVSAPAVARERGLTVREERIAEPHDYASLLTVSVRGARRRGRGGRHRLRQERRRARPGRRLPAGGGARRPRHPLRERRRPRRGRQPRAPPWARPASTSPASRSPAPRTGAAPSPSSTSTRPPPTEVLAAAPALPHVRTVRAIAL